MIFRIQDQEKLINENNQTIEKLKGFLEDVELKNRKELCKKSKLIDELGMKLQHFQWQINDLNKEKQMKIKKYVVLLFYIFGIILVNLLLLSFKKLKFH